MRILVTGGAGFIGSNFVRRTLEDAYPGLEGADVVVLDALTYSGNLENLAPVADSPRYEFVHGDIRDADLLDRILPGVDAIVHFAADSHVDRIDARSERRGAPPCRAWCMAGSPAKEALGLPARHSATRTFGDRDRRTPTRATRSDGMAPTSWG